MILESVSWGLGEPERARYPKLVREANGDPCPGRPWKDPRLPIRPSYPALLLHLREEEVKA